MAWAVSGSTEQSCDLEKWCMDKAKVTVSVQGSAMPQMGDGIIPQTKKVACGCLQKGVSSTFTQVIFTSKHDFSFGVVQIAFCKSMA